MSEEIRPRPHIHPARDGALGVWPVDPTQERVPDKIETFRLDGGSAVGIWKVWNGLKTLMESLWRIK